MPQCPICDAEVILADDTIVGELLQCQDCGSELEVTEVSPPELDIGPELEEDWGQ